MYDIERFTFGICCCTFFCMILLVIGIGLPVCHTTPDPDTIEDCKKINLMYYLLIVLSFIGILINTAHYVVSSDSAYSNAYNTIV